MQQFDLEVETSGELIKKEGESYLAIRSSAGKRSFLSRGQEKWIICRYEWTPARARFTREEEEEERALRKERGGSKEEEWRYVERKSLKFRTCQGDANDRP